jgi:hypothetical protein
MYRILCDTKGDNPTTQHLVRRANGSYAWELSNDKDFAAFDTMMEAHIVMKRMAAAMELSSIYHQPYLDWVR